MDTANIILPNYLKQYITEQNYQGYTPFEHSTWRYVMRQNKLAMRKFGYKSYIERVKRTRLRSDRIPRLNELNTGLGVVGWSAVMVDSFLPPSVYLEFLANRILPVSANIRPLSHFGFWFVPDVLHEAGGHAPLFSDKDYKNLAEHFWFAWSKTFPAKDDLLLCEVKSNIAHLKVDGRAGKEELKKAEHTYSEIVQNRKNPSEFGRMSRFHDWVIEYGLIGKLHKHKVFGASLISSITEREFCLSKSVKKTEASSQIFETDFDFLKPVSQLFVTPSFTFLSEMLEQQVITMAFRTGGAEAVKQAVSYGKTSTVEFSSGIQVSGIISSALYSEKGVPAYIQTSGPTVLATGNKQLKEHGKEYHKEGYGTPVGRLKGYLRPLERINDEGLKTIGLVTGQTVELEYESGLTVNGKLENVVKEQNKNILMTFSDCTVKFNGKILFDPSKGRYDMAMGDRVTSAYPGSADKLAFDIEPPARKERTLTVPSDERTKRLFDLLATVRECRRQKENYKLFVDVWKECKKDYPEEWLIPLEILEIEARRKINPGLEEETKQYLEKLSESRTDLKKIIKDGMELVYPTLTPLSPRGKRRGRPRKNPVEAKQPI